MRHIHSRRLESHFESIWEPHRLCLDTFSGLELSVSSRKSKVKTVLPFTSMIFVQLTCEKREGLSKRTHLQKHSIWVSWLKLVQIVRKKLPEFNFDFQEMITVKKQEGSSEYMVDFVHHIFLEIVLSRCHFIKATLAGFNICPVQISKNARCQYQEFFVSISAHYRHQNMLVTNINNFLSQYLPVKDIKHICYKYQKIFANAFVYFLHTASFRILINPYVKNRLAQKKLFHNSLFFKTFSY